MNREQLLKDNLSRIEVLRVQSKSANEKVLNTPFSDPNKDLYKEEWKQIQTELNTLLYSVMPLENAIQCLQNGGELTTLTDKLGKTHESIPDFRRVETLNIGFDEDTILESPRPKYIPVVDEKSLEYKGYVFDAIRIEKDTYILSTKSFKWEEENMFVIVTLDQLVLILDYYTKKAKAVNELQAEKRSAANEAYWDRLPEDRRSLFLNQKGIYFSLPAKIKKTITQADYELLDWRQKEKLYKFYKRYGAKRLVSKLDETHMWVSFHDMYQQFINPDAHPINSKGEPQIGKRSGLGLYGNKEAFAYWYWFRDMLDFKIKDIKSQRDEMAESYQQAMETSFGASNTNDTLKDEFGILVKRQNGDPINPMEIEQIRDAWSMVQKTFGNLKVNANKHNIKVSHSGNRLMFAMKAIGVYISNMGTIGVSNKYGDEQFKSTLSHEIAHFIDNFIGELNGKRWASDDYEGSAGQIAFTFRNNMNKPKSQQTDYVNSTKECFARAFQQYFGYINFGDEASIAHSYVDLGTVQKIYNADNFLSKDNFTQKIQPLIEKFLAENKDVFAVGADIDNSNELVPVGSEAPITPIDDSVNEEAKEIQETIEGLEILLSISEESEKQEITDAIEGLKILLHI